MKLSDFVTIKTGTRFRVRSDLNIAGLGLVTCGSVVQFLCMEPHWLDAEEGMTVPPRPKVPMFALVKQGDLEREIDGTSEWEPFRLLQPGEEFCCYARDVERVGVSA